MQAELVFVLSIDEVWRMSVDSTLFPLADVFKLFLIGFGIHNFERDR